MKGIFVYSDGYGVMRQKVLWGYFYTPYEQHVYVKIEEQ